MADKYDILIVPGGGIFADAVREIYSRFKIPEKTAHQMALLAMDQYGLLLKCLLMKYARVIFDISEATDCFKDGKIALFMASRTMINNRALPKSWDVTSDSIAAYVAEQIRATKLLLIKSVDGLYESVSSNLLSKVLVDSLDSKVEPGCVDRHIQSLLKASRINCFIVNGRFPDRVGSILRGDKTVCTEILYG